MLSERKEIQRDVVEMLCTDQLVPKDHLLRKIDAAIDFGQIRAFVSELYCADNGRPSVDPVVLFKIVLLQHLYGIRSMRQTIADVEMNISYRWFLGYCLNESIPHFATVSYNFRHRFTEETIEKIFEWILTEVAQAGYLSPEVVFVDGTHIKANANTKKQVKKAIPKAAKAYEKQLREEINADRVAHGKKPFDDDPPNQEQEVKEKPVSTTDPESGLFHKGEHKKCFAYTAQVVCDKHNFVLASTVNAGNMHDSVAFDALYAELMEHYKNDVRVVTADAGYKTPWICKQILDDGKKPSLPYKRPMGKKGFFYPHEYVYDEYYNCVLCPENQILKYSTTNKEGYREYKSDPKICKSCPSRERCTHSKNCQKVVTIHIWREYVDQAEDIRHSLLGKETYAMRKETIERVFADAKEKYGMRYTLHRGLGAVRSWVKLKFAAMNLKKLAMWRWKDLYSFLEELFYIRKFAIFN